MCWQIHHCLLNLTAEECSKGKENIWEVFFYYQTDLEIVSTEGYTNCSLQLSSSWLVYFSCFQNVSVHASDTSISASVRVPWRGQQPCVPPDQLADICLVLGETRSSCWLGPVEGGGNTMKLLLKPTQHFRTNK